MSTLNPTDSASVSRAIVQQAQYLADAYAMVTKFYIDLGNQLADNGAALGLTTAQQNEIADWKANVVGALKNAFEGTAITAPASMVNKISQQRPLGK